MTDPVTRTLFDALVRRAGGTDAFAAVLEARYGVGHKGTVSKMCSGQIGVTVDALVAVEDAVGAYPITTLMFARLSDPAAPRADLRDLAAQSAIAVGAAHAVLMVAHTDGSDGGSSVTAAEARSIIATMRQVSDTVARIIAEAESILDPVPAQSLPPGALFHRSLQVR